MTTLDEHNSGDYVLVHKTKAKISRARKLVIGTMMVGAVAAIAGAGTFASFSASTDNSAAFSTARMALTNGGNCTTPAGVAASGVASSDVDTNNKDCAPLFPDPLSPGELATKDVTVQNVGDVAGNLYLFATSACNVTTHLATYDRGTATNLCDRVGLTVESGGVCLYPASGSPCATMTPGDSSTNTFTDFGSNKQFASKIDLASLATNASKTIRVSAMWRRTTGTAACAAALVNHVGVVASEDGNTDGFVDSTGQGCDNPYMNQTANLTMRWQIQG